MNIKLNATVGGHPYQLDQQVINEAGELTPIAIGLLTRGFQKILTDAHSTSKRGSGENERKSTPEERQEDVEKRLAKLIDGTYSFGGGGRTTSTPEQKALKHTLQKYGIKFAKGQTIENGLEALAKAIAGQANKDFEPEMTQTIKTQLEETDIYKTKLEAERQSNNPIPTAAMLKL